MICCPRCFGDQYFESWIFKQKDLNKGICEYCGTHNIEVIHSRKLNEPFYTLLRLYRPCDESGSSLVHWFRMDFGLFEGLDDRIASTLLGDILDDELLASRMYKPRDIGDVGTVERWDNFRRELRLSNRFFLKTALDFERIQFVLTYLCRNACEVAVKWYRARIADDKREFSPSDMGAPPHDRAVSGRANPVGISYLYLASNIQTALSELRPHRGQTIAYADFDVPGDLNLIDLRDPRKTMSPFRFIADDIPIERGDFDLFARFGRELAEPVIPSATSIDYLPTQYLCEFIKHCDYDGVVYSSSMGEGVNLALFNPDVGNVHQVQTKSVTHVQITCS